MNDRNVLLVLVPFFAMMKKLPRVFRGKNPILFAAYSELGNDAKQAFLLKRKNLCIILKGN